LGTINVIFAASGRTSSHSSRVMSVARLPTKNSKPEPKRARVKNRPTMSFSEEDKVGTIQSYDDALGAVSSTLHLKVKYLSKDRIEELVGSQSVVR